MRIGLTGAIAYPPIVREKHDGGGPGQEKSQNSEKQKGDSPSQQESDENSQAFDEQLVGQAVAEFQADKQAQASGLSASVNGHGPGLKVVLRDGSGGVVRQLSAEEFLKLRQALSKESHLPGKILDQKL